MKKPVLFIAFLLAFAANILAADMTEVWKELQLNKEFIVADIAPEKAARNGFETLSVALNSAPSSHDINTVKNLMATVEPSQKVTSVSQKGVDVSVYAAPASADGSLYKLMLVVDKNDNEDKALIILYGICTQSGIGQALTSLSIEDIIGS